MLLKWIRCGVTDRPEFHRGQLAWERARDWPGFLGQRGGWDSPRDGADFCQILGFWNERDQYDGFMCGPLHDDIAAGQVPTMASIRTRVFTVLGERGRGFLDTDGSGFVNIVSFDVPAERIAEVREHHVDAWDSGFDAGSEARAGVCAADESGRFVIASLWDSADQCRAGRDALAFDAVPAGSRGSGFEAVSDDTFPLEPAWSV